MPSALLLFQCCLHTKHGPRCKFTSAASVLMRGTVTARCLSKNVFINMQLSPLVKGATTKTFARPHCYIIENMDGGVRYFRFERLCKGCHGFTRSFRDHPRTVTFICYPTENEWGIIIRNKRGTKPQNKEQLTGSIKKINGPAAHCINGLAH